MAAWVALLIDHKRMRATVGRELPRRIQRAMAVVVRPRNVCDADVSTAGHHVVAAA
jgi:hypothetical protein